MRELCGKFLKKDSHFSGIFGERAARSEGRRRTAGRRGGTRELLLGWVGMFFFLSDIGLAACQRLDDHMDL